MSQILPSNIPLSRITRVSPLNPRHDQSDDVSGLAATIVAAGLIIPILVRYVDEDDAYEVLAGQRRWRALRSLGVPDMDVPCHVFHGGEAETLKAVTAESVTQSPLHPVDQFRCFHALAEAGQSVADIARDFALTEIIVRQRLALVKIAPELLDLWRAGAISRDTAEAFAAFGATQEAQRAALAKELALPERERWSIARIRRALRGEHVGGEDPLALFFFREPERLATYLAAGGAEETSLFDEERRLLDRSLARRTAHALLLREAERIAWDEGFGFGCIMDADTPDPLEIEPDHTEAEEQRFAEIASELSGAGPALAAALMAESDELQRKGLLRAVPATMRATLGVACDIAPDGGIETLRFIPSRVGPGEHHHDDDHGDAEGAPESRATEPRAAERKPRAPKEAAETDPRPAPEPPQREPRAIEAILTDAATQALRALTGRHETLAAALAVAALGCSHGRSGVHLEMRHIATGESAPASALLRAIAHERFETALRLCADTSEHAIHAALTELIARSIFLDSEQPAQRDALLGFAARHAPVEFALCAVLDHEAYFAALSREEIVETLRGLAGDAEANDAARLPRKNLLAQRAARLAKDRSFVPEALLRALRQGAEPPPAPDQRSTAHACVEAIAADEASRSARDTLIDAFLAERCRRGPEAGRTKAATLYAAFVAFAEARDAEPVSLRDFGEALAARGVAKKRVSDGVHYLELALAEQQEKDGSNE